MAHDHRGASGPPRTSDAESEVGMAERGGREGAGEQGAGEQVSKGEDEPATHTLDMEGICVRSSRLTAVTIGVCPGVCPCGWEYEWEWEETGAVGLDACNAFGDEKEWEVEMDASVKTGSFCIQAREKRLGTGERACRGMTEDESGQGPEGGKRGDRTGQGSGLSSEMNKVPPP